MKTPDDRIMMPDAPRPAIGQCIVGDTLCQVYVLTEAQWDAMPEAKRPATAEYRPGLGWVVATPGQLKGLPRQ